MTTLGSAAVTDEPQPETTTAKVKEVQKTSVGCIDFCFGFSVLMLGTVCSTILIAMLIAIPIAMIVIGAVHRKNCPASPHIPIWLIQLGVMILARKCAFILSQQKSAEDQNDKDQNAKDQNAKDQTISNSGAYSTLDLLIGWWPLIGAILVFEIDPPEYDNRLAENYCHYTLYKFSLFFVCFTIATLILAALGKLWKYFNSCVGKIKRERKKKLEGKTADVEASEQEAMT